MNLSDMEAKVREATNNEPWGAPTTLMAQIAGATYNYREREEILSFIFRRFTEKAANAWRQIYKSLQLLDYLLKNGSERIIDDVRANLSLIQMLKSFHYIDSKGRDQGINVRNRCKNLIAFLNDDAMIRLERKKARANAKKFGGVSSAAYGGASSIATGNGFEDDDFTNKVYGDGGVFGARYDDPASAYDNGATGADTYEEYNVEASSHAARPTTGSSAVHATAAKNKEQPKAPEEDLLGDLLGDSTTAAPQAVDADDDDDFDDFQSAPTLSATTGSLANNLANLYVSQPAQNYGNVAQASAAQSSMGQASYPSANYAPQASVGTRVSSGPAKPSNDAFSSLFTSAKSKKTAPVPVSHDDDFGGFSSNASQPAPAQSTAKPAAPQATTGEVDLLSF